METEYFKTKKKDGKGFDHHSIDDAGNHFKNGRCINPKEGDGYEIGDTHPPKTERIYRGDEEE